MGMTAGDRGRGLELDCQPQLIFGELAQKATAGARQAARISDVTAQSHSFAGNHEPASRNTLHETGDRLGVAADSTGEALVTAIVDRHAMEVDYHHTGTDEQRMNADIRIIVHRADGGVLLCYVGHHDHAYRGAKRRKIERHPVTGSMQLVEIRERVEQGDLLAPKPATPSSAPTAPKPLLFDKLRKLDLTSFGVSEGWVDDVHRANKDTFFDLIQHLPQ